MGTAEQRTRLRSARLQFQRRCRKRQRNRRSARPTLHIRVLRRAGNTATAAPIFNRRKRANSFKATPAERLVPAVYPEELAFRGYFLAPCGSCAANRAISGLHAYPAVARM